MMKQWMILATVLGLAACGSVGNTVLSDAKLQEKAAVVLRTQPENVMISNRASNIGSITFTATVRGKVHQCYVKTTGVTVSDAVCSGMRPVIHEK